MNILELILISFVLNVLWTMMGRARNRNNLIYHGILVFISNILWICFMKTLMTTSTYEMVFACIGSTFGSICGQPISMKIEKYIKANSDDHI